MRSRRILVAEEGESLSKMLKLALDRGGYERLRASDGEEAFEMAYNARPDLIILDAALPGLDGFEVTRRLREERVTREIGIIMVAEGDEEEVALQSFAAGATDFMRKPITEQELAKRISALLERPRRHSSGRGRLKAGDLEIDEGRQEVWRRGVPVELSLREFKLLHALVSAGGGVVTRDELLDRVWGTPSGEGRTVDVHVHRLRKKLEGEASSPRIIQSVRGRGYRLRQAS